MENKITNSLPLRILHCAGFHLRKYAGWYESVDSKLSRGLTLNGHLVYEFSYRDVARAEAILPTKKLGNRKANQRLIEAARNLVPDLLLLGHSETIHNDTIRQIRREHPKMKVAMWYCDAIWLPKRMALLQSKREIADVIFATTGGSMLKEFASSTCRTSFFPNPVDSAIECYKSFERSSWEHDLFFAGTEKGAPERTHLLREILANPEGDLRVRIHKAFGEPAIGGHAYLAAIAKSMTALNLSNRWDVPWYSSDRLAHIVGNGTAAICPRTPGLPELLGEEGAIWFESPGQLQRRLRQLVAEPDQVREIGRAGWQRLHQIASSKEVAGWMLEFLYEKTERAVCWASERVV